MEPLSHCLAQNGMKKIVKKKKNKPIITLPKINKLEKH